VHTYYSLVKEVVLPQTDRATSCISKNLVNYRRTVGTSCTKNPQQIEVVELVLQSTDVLRASSNADASDRRVLTTSRSTCRGEIF